MNVKRRDILACCLLIAAGLGCVRLQPLDSTLLARYQERILAESPQSRPAGEDLGLLMPTPARQGEPLKTVEFEGGVTGIELSLEQAVRMALANNVDIQVVSFEPAISREEMIQAVAAFDGVVFGSLAHVRTNERMATLFTPSKSRLVPLEVGVRKRNTYGGEAALTFDLARTSDNNSTFVALSRRYEATTTLSLTQPLLRGAGPDYNLAALRLASLTHDVTRSQFRQRVEEVIAAVETVYWALSQARRDLLIRRRLLKLTEETQERILKRIEVDAPKSVTEQVRAAVQTRKASVVAGEKTVRDIQDQLARLLSDPQLGLIRKYEVIPVTPPVETAVAIDGRDQLVAALVHSPALQQARLAIEARDISVRVAKNETLPSLNLSASVTLQGMKRYWDESIEDMGTGDFLSHSIGLVFEYPIGNRERLSRVRQRRLEKLQAVAELQNAADQVALSVNEIVRRAQSNHELIGIHRAAVEASQAQLKSLDDIENIRGRLTPEFLQLKLQTQDQIAQSERSELDATIQFNSALAELHRTTGTTLLRHNIELAVEGIAGGRAEAPPMPAK